MTAMLRDGWTVPATAYVFEGRDGEVPLRQLFGNRPRLAVYHTMPDRSSPGASAGRAALAAGLRREDSRLILVSRAPYAKLAQYHRHLGWDLPCYSVASGDFTGEFAASLRAAPLPDTAWGEDVTGVSFFHRKGSSVVYTTSVAVPGLDFVLGTLEIPDRIASRAHDR
jgi:predicted dithiol-disulfide oxidoreductase (DUF899 family)